LKSGDKRRGLRPRTTAEGAALKKVASILDEHQHHRLRRSLEVLSPYASQTVATTPPGSLYLSPRLSNHVCKNVSPPDSRFQPT